MPKLVFIRHGQSVFNRNNIFTGWVDVSLTKEGIEEAIEAGRQIADISFDSVFTSTLIRAQTTTALVLAQNQNSSYPTVIHEQDDRYTVPEKVDGILPIYVSDALNERVYGDLQGLNKDEVKKEVGEKQFKEWRRSYDIAPPGGESLKDTLGRVLPYFDQKILPRIVKGETVLVSAHGNSLRAMVKELDNISDEDIVNLEIGTGVPIIYEFDEGMWNKIER